MKPFPDVLVIGSLSCQLTEIVEQLSHYIKITWWRSFKFGTVFNVNVVRNTSLKLKIYTHVCSGPLFVKMDSANLFLALHPFSSKCGITI